MVTVHVKQENHIRSVQTNTAPNIKERVAKLKIEPRFLSLHRRLFLSRNSTSHRGAHAALILTILKYSEQPHGKIKLYYY